MGSLFKALFVVVIVLAITGGIGLAIMAGVAGTHDVKPIPIPGDCSLAVLAAQWDYADAFRRPMEFTSYKDIHQIIENAPLKGDGEIHRTAKEVVYAGSWPGVNYQIAYILDRDTYPYAVELVTVYRFKGSQGKRLLKVYRPIHRCLAPFLLDRLGSRAPS
jgi:hypothetical protein